MRGQVRLIVATLLAVTLAACSTSADPASSTTQRLIPSGSFVEPSGVPDSESSNSAVPPPTVPTPSAAESPTATTGRVTVAPLPAGLTADQVADANAAIAVYEAYWSLIDQASSDPGSDWSVQVSGVAAGTSSDVFLNELASLNKRGIHTTGRTSVEGTVTKVEPALVHLSGCVDVSRTDVLDSSGNSVAAPDGPGSYARFTTTAQVGQGQGGQWLVTVDTYNRDQTC